MFSSSSVPGCMFEADSEECAQYQRDNGCHVCDVKGCWRRKATCPFKKFPFGREKHSDARFGDAVPHMRQVNAICVVDGAVVSTKQSEKNW